MNNKPKFKIGDIVLLNRLGRRKWVVIEAIYPCNKDRPVTLISIRHLGPIEFATESEMSHAE